jgi:hypothetical protein
MRQGTTSEAAEKLLARMAITDLCPDLVYQ